jgi:hypothetical protein
VRNFGPAVNLGDVELHRIISQNSPPPTGLLIFVHFLGVTDEIRLLGAALAAVNLLR